MSVAVFPLESTLTRTPSDLAKLIAREAIAEPFRQINPLPTEKFRAWLKERDVQFFSWETLHFLWAVGVVRPVAVSHEAIDLTPDLASPERFEEMNLGRGNPGFVDLGVAVESVPLMPPWQRKLPYALRDSLLWHPFQLPEFLDVVNALRNNMALDMALKGPEACGKFAAELTEGVPNSLLRFAHDDRRLAFERLLGLLLAAEPVVHPHVHGQISVNASYGETFDAYFDWREGLDIVGLIDRAGLSIEQATAWHSDLSIKADLIDPLDHFRVLLQHANREDRKRLRGAALAAHELYDQAETLRRYLESFHGCQLYEEDDYRSGSQNQSVKMERYGTERAADADRQALWRIIRDFGLDAQIKATWFLEGDTEAAFFVRLAELEGVDLERTGLVLYNLRGNQGHDRNHVLRHLLQQHRVNGAFAFIALDQDAQSGTSHVDDLKRMARQGLLTAGYRIWEPDFEEANFSLEELASAATTFAHLRGSTIIIRAADISNRMQQRNQAAGKAIESLLKSHRLFEGKGPEWGRCLAEVAHNDPKERPALEVLGMLLRARWSDFDGTIEYLTVDDHGRLVDRERD